MGVFTAKIKDNEVDCIKFGKGKSNFVIIPGLSLKSVILSAGEIEKAYSGFAEEYTVYLFDRARKIRPNTTVFDLADDTVQAMQALGIGSASVFGVSQGGMMAEVIAAEHPELVEKLILGSTTAGGDETLNRWVSKWIRFADGGDVVGLNHSFFEAVYTRELLNSLKDVLPELEKSGTKAELEKFSKTAKACLGFNIYNKLEKIQCPTLVIGAMQDKVIGWEESVKIAEKIGCEVCIYEKYGHAVYDEAPDYKQKILQFLKTH